MWQSRWLHCLRMPNILGLEHADLAARIGAGRSVFHPELLPGLSALPEDFALQPCSLSSCGQNPHDDPEWWNGLVRVPPGAV